jgi:hypothetical protein
MTSTDPCTTRINGPAELLAAVPYLLGFHPEESLVLVGLADGALVVTARLDLADAAPGRCLGDTFAAIVRGGTTQVVGIVFAAGRAKEDRPQTLISTRLQDEAGRAGVELIDVMTVIGDRWWSELCTDTCCCPPEGRVLASEPTAFGLASIVAGTVVAPSREAMAQRLAPMPDRQRLQVLIDQAESTAAEALLRARLAGHDSSLKRAIFAAARAAAAGVYPADADVARYGAALSRTAIRDAVWLAVDGGRLADGNLWLDLARRLPAPYDASALFLYGWQAWRDGNGALASVAAERAVVSDASYSAAHLLLGALARGVDPRRVPTLRPPKGGDAFTA